MRVLFISSFLLFPETRSGAAKRLYYFAQAIRREAELSLITLDAGEEAAAFDGSGVPSDHALWVRYERSFLDKFRDPFDVPQYLTSEMAARVDAFIREARPDVVFCAFAFALSLIQIPALAECKNLVYLEDDLSFEVFRERAETATNWKRRLHMRARWWQAERFYARLLPRAKCFVSISDEEAAVVRRKFPWLDVSIVRYGIPLEEFPLLPVEAPRTALGFIGNYIHQSNCDAMDVYLRDWHPALCRAVPGTTIVIAGKNLPAPLAAAHRGDASITFRDNVPTLEEFYHAMAIFVNPIVSQRGLRTKLVEAAAYGRPIITTRLGAEGLGELDLLIAETADEAAARLKELQSPERFAAVAENNRRKLEEHYSLEAVGRQLLDCLKRHAR